MVVINEAVRLTSVNKEYQTSGITSINSSKKIENRCTWQCHNNTQYCKKQHVSLVKEYFNIIDPVYFGIITALQSTGSYGLANIIILVLGIPLIICYFLTRSIYIEFEIRKIKRNARNH